MKQVPHRRASRRPQRLACLAAVLALPLAAWSTDVYVSRGADGTMRYATQALDPSYTRLFADGTSPTPIAPSLPVESPASRVLRPIIEAVAQRHGVSPGLVEAVIAVESRFDARAVSVKGARGAMQLMPDTGRRYGLKEPADFEVAERNIDAGVRHLKDLLAEHHGNVALALAAYNAGPRAVARHGRRIPPYRETMLYVPAVLSRAGEPAAPPAEK